MQARVYLQPLANAAGDYQDEILINNDLLERMRLEQRTNQSKWSAALLYPSLDTITCDNSDGRYDTSAGANSLFALAGADRARIRVEYPIEEGSSTYQTIFRGQIATKASTQNPFTGKASWKVRSPDIAFVDQSLNPGLITQGMTVRQAIEAAFTDLQIAAAIPNLNMDNFFDPVAEGTTIANEDRLLGEERAADRTLEKLLLAGDNLMTYVPYRQEARIMRRGELADYANGRIPWSSGYIDDPISILSIEDGVERVYNSVSVSTGISGSFANLVEEDRGSISRWGRRTLTLDLTWVQDLDQCQAIAKNLLSRLSRPQKLIEVIVPLLRLSRVSGSQQIFGQEAIVGGLVGVHIPAKAPRSAPKVGTARVGEARPSPITYNAIQGSFYIEKITRSFRADIARVSLRQYIGTGE